MKFFVYVIVITLVLFTAQPLVAEETIKVLILENLHDPILTENAEKIGTLQGELFINDSVYRGFIEVRKDENGLHFIDELPFEKYIEGVVSAEIGKDWAMEALKVQAVISRTYAVYQKKLNAEKDYHITSSVFHQVYKGDNSNEMISRAVKETDGEILTYEDNPIEAFYHSTCKGKTELPGVVWGKNYPYIKSVVCRGKNSPYEQWLRRFSFYEMEKVLGVKNIKDIRIDSFTSTGRVHMLKVVTEDSEMEIRAVDLRKLLGFKELPSTQFSLTIAGRDIIFEGGGYGHGVGLSQWGALELAKEGKTYKEILEHYYPGTVLNNNKRGSQSI